MTIAALFISVTVLAALVACGAAFAAEPAVFRPKPIEDVLFNPHMGFQTFQHFNGDPLFDGKTWTEVGPETIGPKPATLTNPNHPYSTVAYCRWYWDTIEPESGVYRFDIIDLALETARERGQTLAIRVMCHDHEGKHDVPEWFKKSGARGGTQDVARGKDIRYWLPDYSDPLYIKHWTRVNAELAARYDGHPDLESVDCASIGPWGEWSTKPVDPPMWAKAALIDCYTDHFKRTPLLMQFDDPKSMRYGVEHGTGWRSDCLGDMGGFSKTWCHMFDSYPEGIIYGGAVDAWKTAPVAFEVCWVMGHWHDMGWDPEYIFDQAVKWHMTVFNTKSSAVPQSHWPAVNRCLKRMGYRFVCRKFLCPPVAHRGQVMRFKSWWENRGCAPIYRKYDLAFELASGGTKAAVKTDADITKWLPGDIVFDDGLAIPYDIPAGRYTLRVGLVSRQTGEAKIQLAQEGRAADGWYELGQIEVA
jgi:hypothetical protein